MRVEAEELLAVLVGDGHVVAVGTQLHDGTVAQRGDERVGELECAVQRLVRAIELSELLEQAAALVDLDQVGEAHRHTEDALPHERRKVERQRTRARVETVRHQAADELVLRQMLGRRARWRRNPLVSVASNASLGVGTRDEQLRVARLQFVAHVRHDLAERTTGIHSALALEPHAKQLAARAVRAPIERLESRAHLLEHAAHHRARQAIDADRHRALA